VLLDFRDDYYRYLSYDQADDQAAVLEESRMATMESLARNRVVSDLKYTLKQEKKAHGQDAVGFLLANERALFHALKPWNTSVQALVRFFLKKSERTPEEEVFLLMAVTKLTEN